MIDTRAHLRFPQFSSLPELVGLLEGIGDAPGAAATMQRFIGAAGYAIGACWKGDPLRAGTAPGTADEAAWMTYGTAVADEVQGMGWSFGDLQAAIRFITAEVGAAMTDLGEAEAGAKNS